ncbi:MAG: hypothetical protein ABI550_08655 [Ignavibacteriaceae bacterium]
MKKIWAFFAAGLLIAGCASTKEMETTSIKQSDCRNETTIKDSKEFVSETGDNLSVYQEGDLVYASVDIKTYCNAQISFDTEVKDNELRLKLKNTSGLKDTCVCIKNVSATLKNVAPKDYKIFVTNQAGNQLLTQTTFTVK